MEQNQDVCVVVPAFNESSAVGEVVTDLRRVFPKVVCVDDGSTDGTADVALASGATVVRHPFNVGAGAALQTGLTYALDQPRMRYVITFDADGQHRVEDAVEMLEVARTQQVDVVLGSRFLNRRSEHMPASRRALLRAAVYFTRLTSGVRLTDAHNGLRVLNRRAVGHVGITLHGMSHASELLDQFVRAGLCLVEHPVTVTYSDYSRSKGQKNINAVNISFDLLGQKLRSGR